MTRTPDPATVLLACVVLLGVVIALWEGLAR